MSSHTMQSKPWRRITVASGVESEIFGSEGLKYQSAEAAARMTRMLAAAAMRGRSGWRWRLIAAP
jgi:hypothetical protein